MNLNKKNIGILRGGQGDNYENSIKQGGDLILHLFENFSEKIQVHDILVDQSPSLTPPYTYIWHINGLPIIPADLFKKVDLIWNLAHPSLSQILKDFSVPSISGGIFSGNSNESRENLKYHMKNIGVNMPRHVLLPAYCFQGQTLKKSQRSDLGNSLTPQEYAFEKARQIFEKFGAPWIIHLSPALNPTPTLPEGEGVNLISRDAGIYVAKTFVELVNGIKDGISHKQSILIEELISGKNISTHAVSNFRNQGTYIFPFHTSLALHKEAPEDLEKFNATDFFKGQTLRTQKGLTLEKIDCENLAKNIHQHLDMPPYLKLDFILNPTRGIFLNNINFTPDLKKDSHFHQSCESVGAKVDHVLEAMLKVRTSGIKN
ncbi:MAG: hypothetical protein AAB693_00485 [Patescibacteria group bacterium]